MTRLVSWLLCTTILLSAVHEFACQFGNSWIPPQPAAGPWGRGPPVAHNLTLGKPGKYDKLLYLTRVKRPAHRGGVVETVHYPPSWAPLEFITAIHVEDQWRNGSNGFPYLANGGLYQREATVRLESGPRYGLDFIVKFYGH